MDSTSGRLLANFRGLDPGTGVLTYFGAGDCTEPCDGICNRVGVIVGEDIICDSKQSFAPWKLQFKMMSQ
eukprot:m.23879 g.23879  ORF g.23879 m.23879 type:complete len:70 (-) comp7551_c0_seq1:141-350(-)